MRHRSLSGLGIGIAIRGVDYVEIISMSQLCGFRPLYKWLDLFESMPM